MKVTKVISEPKKKMETQDKRVERIKAQVEAEKVSRIKGKINAAKSAESTGEYPLLAKN
jgi:hypothetical protein